MKHMSTLLLVSSSNRQNILVRSHLYGYLSKKYQKVHFVGDGLGSAEFSCIQWRFSMRRNFFYLIPSTYCLMTIFFRYRPSHVISFSPKANLLCNFMSKFFRFSHCGVVTGLGKIAELRHQSTGFFNALISIMYPRRDNWITMNSDDASVIMGRFKSSNICDIPGEGYKLQFCNHDFLKRNREIDFLFLGRIIANKGIFEFLKAIRLLKIDGYKFNVSIVGKPQLNPVLERKFRSLISSLSIQFHGGVSEEAKRHILLNSRVLVFPTRYGEGLPFTILEAQDAGCCVLTSSQAGCVRATSPYNTILLSEPDPVSLKYKLTLALKMFSRATISDIHLTREWVKAEFSQEKSLLAYEVALQKFDFYRV